MPRCSASPSWFRSPRGLSSGSRAFTASRTPVQYALKEATPTTAGWRSARGRPSSPPSSPSPCCSSSARGSSFAASTRSARPIRDSTEGVVTARYWLPFATYPDEASQRAFRQADARATARHPGVEAATITRAAPLGASMRRSNSSRPAAIRNAADRRLRAHWAPTTSRRSASARAGREFGEQDGPAAPSVAVVSESIARLAFPDGPAVGQTLVFAGNAYTVVGVAAEVRQRPSIVETWPMVYFPRSSKGHRGVRRHRRPLSVDAAALAAAIRAVVRDVEPRTRALRRDDDGTDARGIVGAARFQPCSSAPSPLALVLAAFGLYALITYLAAQRTREIGVRIALGATRAHVLRLVLGDGALPVVVGTTLGVAGALALGRVLESQLFGVTPVDPVTYLAAPLMLAAVALLAGWLPARRALRTDPVRALRVE